MFRVKKSEVKGGYLLAQRVFQVALLLANFNSDYVIFREYRRLTIALDRPVGTTAAALATVCHEDGIQFFASLICTVYSGITGQLGRMTLAIGDVNGPNRAVDFVSIENNPISRQPFERRGTGDEP